MLRISPWDKSDRFIQTNKYLIEPAGSESNVAVNLSNLGLSSSFVSAIPDNEMGIKIIRYLKKYQVDTKFLLNKHRKRLGIFWNENGIDIRASSVLYDRENSAFANAKYEEYDWEEIKKEALWFHSSGVTPALTKELYDNVLTIIDNLSKDNIPISIDLNYRDKLWNWVKGEKSQEIPKLMEKIGSKVEVLFGNEEDFQLCLGIESNMKHSNIINKYREIIEKTSLKLPNVKYFAISLRDSKSASVNDWSGLLFIKNQESIELYKGIQYHLTNIVDRVGGGDSFCAGIIYGLINHKNNPQYIIDFATTFSALKHTIRGDISNFSVKDVEKTMSMKGSGRIIR